MRRAAKPARASASHDGLSVLLLAVVLLARSAEAAETEAPTEMSAMADEPAGAARMDEVVVRGQADELLGTATSASQGSVPAGALEAMPLLRRGELLESIPGMAVTQHSGDGKANQYFLRGFNLDHGTDFAFSVDGIPVNLRTHAHGQGYADTSFIIPELIGELTYRKGPFYADVGDFSGAGAADVRLVTKLPRGIATVQGGAFGFLRTLVAASPGIGPGHLLYAADFAHYDGPWVLSQQSNRLNLLSRYSWADGRDSYAVTASVYFAPQWRATNQVPRRAVEAGLISPFGAIDTSDAGRSGRGALSFAWTRDDGDTTTHLTVYAVHYFLDLFSSFTYALDDPERGDQFAQVDRRWMSGVDLRQSRRGAWRGLDVEHVYGVQLRNDYIPTVELDHTQERRLLEVVSHDRVDEASAGVFGMTKIQWTEWFRSELGLRGDVYAFDVRGDSAPGGRSGVAAIVNPKAALVFGPWRNTEVYVDAGSGFHSNDVRGVSRTMTGAAEGRVPLLMRSLGAEVGLRTNAVAGLVSTLSFWFLASDSELVFAGDSGGTEARGPSRRYGVEWATTYEPAQWLHLTVDAALTHARFAGGGHIAGSIPAVVSATAAVQSPWGVFASARVRYLGERPLEETGVIRQGEAFMLNARLGYRLDRFELTVDLLNVLGSKANDIAYYYTSRLAGEPASGVDDVHQHPVEPRALRASLTARF